MTVPQPDPTDEAYLVRCARAGDENAFACLYDHYAERIFRFVRSRVHDDPTGEDLTAQVFMKAWDHLGGYRLNGAPFGAWLFRIARNAIVDDFRRRRRTVPIDEIPAAAAASEAVDGGDGPDPVETERLRRAMMSLSPEQREVLQLRFYGGLQTEEISRAMGKRPGAVRALQMRGLQALAARLGETNGRP